MPKCKYCGQPITKFDKEICPYCGTKNPLDGNNSQTTDITESIKTVSPDDEVLVKYKPKKKVLNALLCMFLGIFGIDALYLGFKNRFLIRLISNAVVYIALMLVFYFTKSYGNNSYLVFLLPLIIVFGVWFIIGIIFLFLKNKKDSNGAFLK